MLRSMTGFGSGKCAEDGREITVELRSVNHKYLDLNFRMPRTLSFLEDALRTAISQRLSRGHLDVTVTYKNTRDDSKSIQIDTALAEQYLMAGVSIADNYGVKNDVTASNLLRMPDVVTVTENDDDTDAITALAEKALSSALDTLIAMRTREGEHLYTDLHEKLAELGRIRDEIEALAANSVLEQKALLEERVAALMPDGVDVDAQRLATEIGIMADKTCVDEELVRIGTHLSHFATMLEGTEPVGRKLDFLVQELHREFNTTGSKSVNSDIAILIIAAKAEIEKMREQIQNIE